VTYVLAILEDETFEDARLILGASEMQVADAVLTYLSAARPVHAETGERWEITATVGLDAICLLLEDYDDVSLRWYRSGRSHAEDGLEFPEAFKTWVEFNADQLRRQHAPRVVDVIDSL
jgi:hypothetical protein